MQIYLKTCGYPTAKWYLTYYEALHLNANITTMLANSTSKLREYNPYHQIHVGINKGSIQVAEATKSADGNITACVQKFDFIPELASLGIPIRAHRIAEDQ